MLKENDRNTTVRTVRVGQTRPLTLCLQKFISFFQVREADSKVFNCKWMGFDWILGQFERAK